MKELEVQATRVFYENHNALLNTDRRYICNEGGARSGKSYNIMILLIFYADVNPGTEITVCSHSLPHLKMGALKDFLDIMKDWGWYNDNEHNKTDQVYRFKNGSFIQFFGLEDATRARGTSRDILFVNEANLVTKEVFDQLDMRTRWKSIIDLNPADFDCWCYALADSERAVKIASTYKDNPFLTKEQISVIESYKDIPGQELWKVYGLGLRGASAETVYTHWKLCEELPDGEEFYGLDFGFVCPAALVRVVIKEGAIFAKELIYEDKLTNPDLIERVKRHNVGRKEIFCDSAEPKTIEEMIRGRLNAKEAEKDVWAGIQKVKSMPLYITRDSKNMIRELGKYKWKTDKDGKIEASEEPVKMDDHLLDALRYAVFTKLGKRVLGWV